LLGRRESAVRNAHGEALLPLVDAVLQEAGIPLRSLTAIGVGVGPGSFTGIRVALGTAIGLRLATGVPLVAVDAFDAIEEAAGAPSDGVVVTVLDALRGEVFVRIRDGNQIVTEPSTATAAAVDAQLRGCTVAAILGPPSDSLTTQTSLRRADEPDAVAVARLAARRPPTDEPEPLYIRPPDISVAKPKKQN
jgi:tRNA threonylcarbamoyladenosine biosynthesis protein TsaB